MTNNTYFTHTLIPLLQLDSLFFYTSGFNNFYLNEQITILKLIL